MNNNSTLYLLFILLFIWAAAVQEIYQEAELLYGGAKIVKAKWKLKKKECKALKAAFMIVKPNSSFLGFLDPNYLFYKIVGIQKKQKDFAIG
jgi:hypothetical protein